MPAGELQDRRRVARAGGVYVDESGGDVIEKHSVVAREEHGDDPTDRLPPKELDGLVVEVVRGLVGQHGIASFE